MFANIWLKIKNAVYLISLRFQIARSYITRFCIRNLASFRSVATILSVFAVVALAAIFVFHVPDHLRRTLKKQFGLGGPPIYKVEVYKVKPMDNFWNIAKKNKLSIDTLITVNKLRNMHSLNVDQPILIPNQNGILYKIQKGETIQSLAEKFKISVEDILDVNDLSMQALQDFTNNQIFLPGVALSADARSGILGLDFFKPVGAQIRCGFGWRNDPLNRSRRQFHTGIDYGCFIGTPVKAAADGQVVLAAEKSGYGICVILRHSKGYTTIYGHLSRCACERGQFVKAGQVIAYSGNTGRSTGPHLHFEVRKHGVPVNPLDVMYFFAAK